MTSIDKHVLLHDLEAEYQTTISEVKRLSQRQSALEKAITGVRELISLNGGGVEPENTDKPSIPAKIYADMTYLDAAVHYLRLVGHKLTNREIADAMTEGGKESSSKRFSDTVRAVLRYEADKADSPIYWTGSHWDLKEFIRVNVSPAPPEDN